MDTIFIPNENDFRKWIKEAIKECLEAGLASKLVSADAESADPNSEPLMSRKEIAYFFRVSLVTLHHWMKGGLPSHKQGGRVYFFRSEVVAYLKQRGSSTAKFINLEDLGEGRRVAA